jgi:predicted N-acyltransferase
MSSSAAPDPPTATILSGIAEIAPAEWDSCAGQANPFVRHAFLDALERSGSAARKTGWTPCHVVVKSPGGAILGCAPLYLKSHSYGEYVFDWGWAEAYQRAGGRYYPKLQCAIPFTPVTGPRLMIRADLTGAEAESAAESLAAALTTVADRMGVSSLHVTFGRETEIGRLERTGFLTRMGYQYHWENRGYAAFADFLAEMASRKRKQIRKEREQVAGCGLTLATLRGADITAGHWDGFHRLYRATVDRKWGDAYLRREFFEELSASTLGDSAVLVAAFDGPEMVAGAFNMLGADTLFGRNWGGSVDVPFLHFEICYYRAIDLAIELGLARVEAGAQGDHKLGRGYLPTPTWSAHHIRDPGLERAVARFLADEKRVIESDIAELAESGPFRKNA